MGSSFKPLCLVGVFGVVGIVGIVGIVEIVGIGGIVGIVGIVLIVLIVGIVDILGAVGFRPLAQWQEITNGQREFPYRQVTNGLEDTTPVTEGVFSLGQEGSTSTGKVTTHTEEIERLKAKLEESGNALGSEVSRLRHLLGEAAAALSSTKEAESTEKIQATITLQAPANLSSVERATERQNAEKEEKIAQPESEVAHLKPTLEEKTTVLSSAEEAAAKREQPKQNLSATNQQQREEVKKTAHRPSTDSEQITTLLAQTTINKADTISVSEVAELVTILNAQIEQTSSLIVDSLFNQESSSTGNELEIAWDELDNYIGSWLCNDLKRRSKELSVEPDPLIMQITLQTGLANACNRIINDWNPPFWIDGSVFSRTYSSIEKTNGQATADAWRALSRTHMTVSKGERQEANKGYLTRVLVRLITAVGGSLESGEILLSQYKEKVEDIVQKAVGLHKTVSEDVTSMELVTYTSPSDIPFDASQMEDTEGNESESPVVCTVEMGLRCRKRDESEKKGGSIEKWGVTKKSRVVLAATLDA